MNKNVTFLFIVKNISYVQFSSCHTSNKNFLTLKFSQTTVVLLHCYNQPNGYCDISVDDYHTTKFQ